MRSEFGSWGADLDDETFAKALTTLGVLGSESASGAPQVLAEWLRVRFLPEPGETVTVPRRWASPDQPWGSLPPADRLAEAWDAFRTAAPDLPVRLELATSPRRDGLRLHRYLAHPSLAPCSVYFSNGWMAQVADWRWPLRVGFFGSPSSRRRSELVGAHWENQLYRTFEASPAAEFSDILVIDGPPPVLGTMWRGDVRSDTNCVLTLGRPPRSWRQIVPLVGSIAAAAHASSVVFADVAEGMWRTWFETLVQNLSHDEPLDLALSRTGPATGAPPALLFAHPNLVRVSRVSHRARILGQVLGDYRVAAEPVITEATPEAEEPAIATVGAGPEEVPAAPAAAPAPAPAPAPEPPAVAAGPTGAEVELVTIADSLESAPPPVMYTSESGPATYVANMTTRAEALIPDVQPDASTLERRILAGVFNVSDPAAPALLRGGFLAGAPHLVEVAIGTKRAGWAAAEVVFPEHELPESAEPHRLTVVLTSPAVLSEPMVATIVLPRTGESTTCSFPIGVIPASLTRLEARISVLFRNRFLQTAILSGPVVAERTVAVAEPDEITVDVEAVVRPGFMDLGSRRHFDLALLFNHTNDDRPAMQSVAGTDVDLVLPVNLDQTVKIFQELLSGVAANAAGYTTLTSPEAKALMISLARQGTFLRDNLFGQQLDTVRQATRVQVVSVNPDLIVPIEFVYDRPSPAPNAELCPNAAARLLDGECGDDCPGGDALPNPFVCPLAFWCTKKVIERRAKDLPPTGGAWVRCDPVAGADELQVLHAAVFGGSTKVDNVDPQGRAKVAAALDRVTGATTPQATTWLEWTASVDRADPSLLVLLPHTDVAENIRTLEIGNDTLALDFFGSGHVRKPENAVPPVVLLLGCNTAITEMPFQSAVVKFRQLGAAVVIGTIATIVGRHAVPMTESLVDALRELAEAGTDVTLSEVIRASRRRLLDKGLVIGLALTAFGDADWRLRSN